MQSLLNAMSADAIALLIIVFVVLALVVAMGVVIYVMFKRYQKVKHKCSKLRKKIRRLRNAATDQPQQVEPVVENNTQQPATDAATTVQPETEPTATPVAETQPTEQPVTEQPVVVSEQTVSDQPSDEPVVEQQPNVQPTIVVSAVEQPVASNNVVATTSASEPTPQQPVVPVVITPPVRLTCEEAYEQLNEENKAYYDSIIAEFNKLADPANKLHARIKNAKYAVTIYQRRDKIGKLAISRGIPVLDCTIPNKELYDYSKSSGVKIKNKPMRFKVKDEKSLNAALFTLNTANKASVNAYLKDLEDKKAARKKKKADAAEQPQE